MAGFVSYRRNEKLQTEKFNPSRAVIEIAVGGVSAARVEMGRNYCWRFMTFPNEER